MAALFEKISLLSSVSVLETVAARRATVIVMDLGFQYVIFEGDAAGVIKALSMRDLALALAGHLVKDFMSIGYSRFLENLLFPRRQGNNVVHALIKGVSFSFLCKFGWRIFHQTFYFMLLKIFQLNK